MGLARLPALLSICAAFNGAAVYASAETMECVGGAYLPTPSPTAVAEGLFIPEAAV